MGTLFEHPVVVLALALLLLPVAGFAMASVSGWRALARAYPERPDPSPRELRYQSVRTGRGVRLQGIVHLRCGLDALRFSIVFPLSLFSPPFSVPWREIRATALSRLLFEEIELRFDGCPEVPLYVHRALARQLGGASRGRFTPPPVIVGGAGATGSERRK